MFEGQGVQLGLVGHLDLQVFLVFPHLLSRMTLQLCRCLSIHTLLIRERRE